MLRGVNGGSLLIILGSKVPKKRWQGPQKQRLVCGATLQSRCDFLWRAAESRDSSEEGR